MATRTKAELSELLHLFLDIGEAIHRAGGEIDRVEDTISRLGAAYGARRTDVFAITSQLVVTMIFPGEIELTRSRRIHGGETDFARLEALNGLSRRVCASPMDPGELRTALRATRVKGGRLPSYLGSALAGGSFAVFFGGGPLDGLVAALFGLLICFLQGALPRICPTRVVVSFTAALATGLGVSLLSLLGEIHADKIMIGDIMLLIPGIALVTAIRNLLVGDTISGVLRLTESLVLAAALAGGFMIAMSLVPPGGAAAPAVSRPTVELVTGALGSLGFGMVFRLRARYLVPAVLGGLLNWGTYLLAYSLTGALFLSCLLAAAVAAVYAEILAQRLRAPATLFLVPALIPSIPGSCLYYTMQAAVVGDFAAASQNGVLTLQWALGIAGGISIVVVILTVIRGVRRRQP